jgi:hypothetical protein
MARTKDGGAIVRITLTAAGVVFGETDLSQWDDDGSIVRDEDAPAPDRIKAAEVMFDRVLGRPTRRRFSRSYDLLAESLVDAARMLWAACRAQKP